MYKFNSNTFLQISALRPSSQNPFRRTLLWITEVFTLLIRSNKMQQYAGIYLLQVYSTCFGRPSRPSSGVQKTVTAACGTGHIT